MWKRWNHCVWPIAFKNIESVHKSIASWEIRFERENWEGSESFLNKDSRIWDLSVEGLRSFVTFINQLIFRVCKIFSSNLPWPNHRRVRLAVARAKIFLGNIIRDHLHLHRHGRHHHRHHDPYVFYFFLLFSFQSNSHLYFNQKWTKIFVFFFLSIARINASNQNQNVEIKCAEK